MIKTKEFLKGRIDTHNITSENKDFIYEICKKYGYEDNKILFRNLIVYYKIETEYGLERNYSLLSKKEVMYYEFFPTGYVEASCLISWWDLENTNDGVSSGQAAGAARGLFKRGFIFQVGITQKGEQSSNRTYWKDSKEYRKIIGFMPKIMAKSTQIFLESKFGKKCRQKVFEEFNIDIRGDSCLSRAEFDHRRPYHIREWGYPAIDVTIETLLDKSWDNDYQIMSCGSNDTKRGVCNICKGGGIIRLPLAIDPSLYLRKANLQGSCEGCFWSNYLKPLHDNKYILEKRREHEQKLERISQEIKRLKK